MKKNKGILVVLMAVLLFVWGCNTPENKEPKENKEEKVNVETSENGKLNVVTTLFPDYSFAKEIAPNANITLLLPPGADSHSFEPSPKDIETLKNADIVIYTGDYMEEWFKQLKSGVGLEEDKIVDASKGIELIKNIDDDHDHDDHDEDDHDEDDHDDHDEHEHHHHHVYDPHIWTSPKLAKVMAKNILDGFVAVDEKNADEYNKNYEKFEKSLDELDSEFEAVVKNSSHPKIYFASPFALKYFARDYKLDVRSVYDTCSSGSEPSAKEMAIMIDEMNEKKAKVIYYAELTDPKLARQIADETGAEPMLFHSCHNLSKEEFEQGKTYLDIMKKNVEALKRGIDD
ncbi:MAG: metal ABC transporter substrate-binding protein [Ezakiella sp.]|nr:metal ABC transporter substrate-binding protein [Bacillota bacterium]MDY3923607.1 metal ABC transporter substrate-binding protein [Ezakiella sp.]